MDVINAACSGEESIVTDAGSAFYVVGQAFRTKHQQRVIVSGALGAMGFALPAATGASFAAPERTVICITGDGSLQTNIHELAVIKHHQLNIKLFVINNNGYISIKNTQDNFFKGHVAGVNQSSGVFIPALSKIAEAYGLSYQSCHDIESLTQLANHALQQPGPMIIEVYANQNQAIIPTVSSIKLESGKMVSKPLDDMFPFMTEEKRQQYMVPVKELV
jgi:acetolactate synthase-1/2/3 large subunit